MHYTPCSYSKTNRSKKECAQRSQCKQLRSTKLVRIVSMWCFVVCHLSFGGIFLFCILFLLFHCVAFLQLVFEIAFEFTWVFFFFSPIIRRSHIKETLVMTIHFGKTLSTYYIVLFFLVAMLFLCLGAIVCVCVTVCFRVEFILLFHFV